MALQPSSAFGVVRVAPDENCTDQRVLATETPVAVSFLGIGYAVMMASPSDLEDFAVGFAFTERIVEDLDQIIDIAVEEDERGILLNIEVSREREPIVLSRVRHRASESSCGLCGIENLDQALRPLPRVGIPPEVDRKLLFEALERIREHQQLNAVTGAVHGAAHFASDGSLVSVREDVGRHNAFDKLIGDALRSDRFLGDGFVVLTSRCSYELVEKAALAGVSLLLTVSAPTTLAVERAREAGLTLVALARSDSMLVISDPHMRFPA